MYLDIPGKYHLQKGFSLIELAIAMIIMGILMTALLNQYSIYLARQDFDETLEAMDMIESALAEFYGTQGRYPCPADPTKTPGDLEYGKEQCRPDITDPCPANLECETALARDTDGENGPDPVLIGVLPIQTLLKNSADIPIKGSDAYDGYGMKFTYAVSELMTDDVYTIFNPANKQMGAINVKDENGRDAIFPASSAHYVVISHGKNREGAYNKEGVRVGDCTVTATATPPPPGNNILSPGMETEIENCDNNDALFVNGLISESLGGNYFDDLVFSGFNSIQQLWARSPLEPNELYLYNTNFGNVGVGIKTPSIKLHVAGNIRAESGIWAENQEGFCDTSEDNCLNPGFIAGNLTECPAGPGGQKMIAVGIEENNLVCEPLFTGPVSFTCPPDGSGNPQFVKSITLSKSGGNTTVTNLDCNTPAP